MLVLGLNLEIIIGVKMTDMKEWGMKARGLKGQKLFIL